MTPDGRILPIAGYGAAYNYLPPGERTPALLEYFSSIYALAVDAQGNLFIAGLDINGFRVSALPAME